MPGYEQYSGQKKRYWQELNVFPPEEMRGEISPATVEVLGASAGNVAEGTGPQHECIICSQDFRISDMVFFRGDWYCRQFQHDLIIASILRKEMADRYIPRPERQAGQLALVMDQSAVGDTSYVAPIQENAEHALTAPCLADQ